MTLLAALVALLYRYTREEDIVVATAVAGRLRAWTRPLIGCFADILMMRTHVSGDPTFRGLLGHVFRTAFEAFYHQELPFQYVMGEMDPERGLSRSRVPQVMLALHDYLVPSVDIPELSVEVLEIHTRSALFDLSVELQERDGRLVGWIQYDNDLFEGQTIARMAGHFRTLLEGAVEGPDRRVSDLPLLTEAERHRLLIEFNATARPVPEATLPALFEVQAARTPEAVALVCGGESLSYAELNARANRLARYLIRLGVGREALVGVCLERSFDMVVGLLSILKAGAAYVPLDPAYPQLRLAYMLRDTRAGVLLTQRRLLSGLPDHAARIVDLESDWNAIAHESSENLPTVGDPSNLAYVMYTSGSTGRPKGVAVPHQAIVRLLFGVDYARFDASLTLLQLSPTSFDASTFELWGALLHGGRCVLFPGGSLTACELGRVIGQQGINTLWLTAALFNAVVDEAPEALSQLEQLLIGGEGALGQTCASLPGGVPAGPLDQWLRTDRRDDILMLFSHPSRPGCFLCFDPDSAADREYPGIRIGRALGARASGRGRRVVRRRSRTGAGIPQSA